MNTTSVKRTRSLSEITSHLYRPCGGCGSEVLGEDGHSDCLSGAQDRENCPSAYLGLPGEGLEVPGG